MKHLYNIAIVLSLVFLCAPALKAQDGDASSFAFSGLTSDLSARSFSLAGASFGRSLGVAHDAAVNPSAMSFSPSRFEAYAQYGNWMPSYCSDKHLSAGAGYVFSKFSFALGASYTLGDKYEVISASGSSEGVFAPSDLLVRAAAAYRIGERFSVGLDARFANSSLSKSVSKQAFCFGVYASYSYGSLSASLGARNLGPKVDGAYYLPSSFAGAVSYSPLKGEKHNVSVDACGEYYFLSESKSGAVSIGAEYSYGGIAFARAGYHFGTSSAPLPSFASAGLGVKLFGVSLDACYLFASETLGGTMMFSLGYAF